MEANSTFKFKNRSEEFRVVGILNPINVSFFDNSIIVAPIDTVQRMAKKPGLVTSVTAEMENPKDWQATMARVQAAMPDVRVEGSAEQLKQVQQQMRIFDLILYSGALLATLVGGLGIANTMYMAVTERTREIGVKKAIGAKDGAVLREYVLEAIALGFIAGALGILAGWGLAQLINAGLGETAFIQFWVTPRLAFGILAFSTILGAVAGYFPARNATRLDPVAALRAE
ncbi:MAG: hypothetical protein A2Z04_04135 [Chloroflexi bacterium RBG_16_57_9]|nr:MAG: hypothetical protein A2Z04_04135 [Chloroflexi bacterium RBG_16_57_9]